MSARDLEFGTYVSVFEVLHNKDASQSVRKISRQILKSANEPRVQLLEALRTDKPAHLLIPESIHAKPGEHFNEFYPFESAYTLDDLGSRFNELIGQGTTREPQLIDIFRQLTKAASYLHQHNFVHQDIRPSNILVGGTVAQPAVTLFDYSNVCRPYQPAQRALSWNVEHPNDPYIDYRFDVFSIGKTLYNLTHTWDDSLKPGLDKTHALYDVITMATHPYEKRPNDAIELERLIYDTGSRVES